MPSIHPLWITLLLLAFHSGYCVAFGAGYVPDYLEGNAFRHGDIEDILTELMIRAMDVTSGAVGFATKSPGKKFSGLNVKRTYFGNWLYKSELRCTLTLYSRDYSQLLDVGTVSRGLDSQAIRILVWILGFLSFGYTTGEFEVFLPQRVHDSDVRLRKRG
jgi:hypothetical protein